MPDRTNFSRNVPDEGRLLIATMDGFVGHVRAHFNPKEIQFDKKVNWTEQKASGHNEPFYEYTSGTPRTMTMELLFDRFEVKDETVEPELELLQRMTMAVDPKSKKESERRPPLLTVSNGPIKDFQCVLESLVVKVTMFDRKGRAVRATANVTFKELRLKGVKMEKPNSAFGSGLGGSGKRDGDNWQKPTDDELARSRKDGMTERQRIAAIRNGTAK